MNATNLRDKKIEEGLKKRCANCGVEYISPVWGELTELRRMNLRKKCDAAEKRKKRSKRSIDEVVKDQAADVNRKKSTREEQARKETPSERERRLGIEACKKRLLRRKEKQDESRGAKKTPKASVTKRKKKLADLLSVDLVRPVLKAQKCDQRTLIKTSSISVVAGTDLLHLSPPKKWTKRQLNDKQKKILSMFFAHRKPATVGQVEEVEDERKPAAKKEEEQPTNTNKWKLTDKQKEMLATLLFDLYFRLSVATVKLKKN